MASASTSWTASVTICELSMGRDKDTDAGQLALALEACASCYEEGGRLEEAEERWAKCVAAFVKVSRLIDEENRFD